MDNITRELWKELETDNMRQKHENEWHNEKWFVCWARAELNSNAAMTKSKYAFAKHKIISFVCERISLSCNLYFFALTLGSGKEKITANFIQSFFYSEFSMRMLNENKIFCSIRISQEMCVIATIKKSFCLSTKQIIQEEEDEKTKRKAREEYWRGGKQTRKKISSDNTLQFYTRFCSDAQNTKSTYKQLAESTCAAHLSWHHANNSSSFSLFTFHSFWHWCSAICNESVCLFAYVRLNRIASSITPTANLISKAKWTECWRRRTTNVCSYKQHKPVSKQQNKIESLFAS